MKASEWLEVTAFIARYWQREIPEDTAEAWFTDVEDIDLREAMTAVKALARTGRDFPPTGGQIRSKAIELRADAPEFAEVWKLTRRYIKTGVTNPIYYRSDYKVINPELHPPNVARKMLDEMPPMIAAFFRFVGNAQLEEAFEQGGAGEARLREKWLSWARRQEREAGLLGLESGLTQVQRVNAAPTHIAEIMPPKEPS